MSINFALQSKNLLRIERGPRRNVCTMVGLQFCADSGKLMKFYNSLTRE